VDAASDAALVARCLANEQGAWDALVDRYARYVYAIAARVYRLEPCAVDTLRRSGRETVVDALPDGPDEGLAELDEAMTVHAALGGLSPDCREILDRFFTRDESYRTIGTELDLPAGTIASRIARCLARLRDVLQPDAVSRAGKKADRPRVG
jgi:hypothetical protein